VVTDALLREIRDPRVRLVTVTRPGEGDLPWPGVVAVPGAEAERQRAHARLQRAAGFLRSRLAKALTTRTIPELRFELDRGIEHAARINQLLAEVRREAEVEPSEGDD
jgi:ribosome-binding factor A